MCNRSAHRGETETHGGNGMLHGAENGARLSDDLKQERWTKEAISPGAIQQIQDASYLNTKWGRQIINVDLLHKLAK